MNGKEKIVTLLFAIFGLSLLISSIFWKEIVVIIPCLLIVSELWPLSIGSFVLMTCGIVATLDEEEANNKDLDL